MKRHNKIYSSIISATLALSMIAVPFTVINQTPTVYADDNYYGLLKKHEWLETFMKEFENQYLVSVEEIDSLVSDSEIVKILKNDLEKYLSSRFKEEAGLTVEKVDYDPNTEKVSVKFENDEILKEVFLPKKDVFKKFELKYDFIKLYSVVEKDSDKFADFISQKDNLDQFIYRIRSANEPLYGPSQGFSEEAFEIRDFTLDYDKEGDKLKGKLIYDSYGKEFVQDVSIDNISTDKVDYITIKPLNGKIKVASDLSWSNRYLSNYLIASTQNIEIKGALETKVTIYKDVPHLNMRFPGEDIGEASIPLKNALDPNDFAELLPYEKMPFENSIIIVENTSATSLTESEKKDIIEKYNTVNANIISDNRSKRVVDVSLDRKGRMHVILEDGESFAVIIERRLKPAPPKTEEEPKVEDNTQEEPKKEEPKKEEPKKEEPKKEEPKKEEPKKEEPKKEEPKKQNENKTTVSENTSSTNNSSKSTSSGGGGGYSSSSKPVEVKPIQKEIPSVTTTVKEEVKIKEAVSKSISQTTSYVQGNGDGYFYPNKAVTRAELVVMLEKLIDKNKYTESKNVIDFKDIKSTAWYKKSATYLNSLGIIVGTPEGNFLPNSKFKMTHLESLLNRLTSDKEAVALAMSKMSSNEYVTKSQMVTALNTIFKREGISEDVKDVQIFKDVDKSHPHYADILNAVNPAK